MIFLHNVQTGYGVHLNSYFISTEDSSPRVNWSGCKAEHLPPSSAKVECMELYHQSFVSLWYDTLLSIETALPLSQGFLSVTYSTCFLCSLFFLLFFVLEVGACMHVLSVKNLSYHYFINTRSTTEALIDVFPLGRMQNHDIKYRLV